jgi:hypothetical protein
MRSTLIFDFHFVSYTECYTHVEARKTYMLHMPAFITEAFSNSAMKILLLFVTHARHDNNSSRYYLRTAYWRDECNAGYTYATLP